MPQALYEFHILSSHVSSHHLPNCLSDHVLSYQLDTHAIQSSILNSPCVFIIKRLVSNPCMQILLIGIFFFKIYFSFNYVCLYMSVHMSAGASWRLGETFGSLRAGVVRGGLEPSYVGTWTRTRILCKSNKHLANLANLSSP